MERLKVLVSGRIAADPGQGGAAWAVLQYLLGLRELGHHVAFVEPMPIDALRPPGATLAGSINAHYFDAVAERFAPAEHAALLIAGTRQTHGCPYERLLDFAASADLLINLSGVLEDDALLTAVARRVYIDLDPAFTQLWQTVSGIDMRLGSHTHCVTIGQAIGQPGCDVPLCGRRWIHSRPPVVMSEWPVANGRTNDAFTTIGNWRSYGSVQHNGEFYGQKAHSLRSYYAVPTLTQQRFLLALSIHADEVTDLQALRDNRWELCDPMEVASTPADYQQFIQQSKAEFGIAKTGYVVSRCGWISDRSVCYLASGRPVIAQDTGFTPFVPAGNGLLCFDSTDTALSGIEAIAANYEHHAAAARELASAYFDSRVVLRQLLDRVGTSSHA